MIYSSVRNLNRILLHRLNCSMHSSKAVALSAMKCSKKVKHYDMSGLPVLYQCLKEQWYAMSCSSKWKVLKALCVSASGYSPAHESSTSSCIG